MAGYQPQQSVLKPQFGQRQTACMRNISVPHRSHTTASDDFLAALSDSGDAVEVRRGDGSAAGPGDGELRKASDMGRLYGRPVQ